MTIAEDFLKQRVDLKERPKDWSVWVAANTVSVGATALVFSDGSWAKRDDIWSEWAIGLPGDRGAPVVQTPAREVASVDAFERAEYERLREKFGDA